MWPLKSILFFVLFWAACVAALVNPIWGVVNYMMVYQLNPPAMWWGQPLVATGMRFSLLAAIFTLAGVLLARRRVPIIRPAISSIEWIIFGLLFIAVLNTVMGTGFGFSASSSFEKFWKLQVFVLILVRLATTRGNFQLALWTIVAGSFYLGWDAFTAPAHAFSKGRLEVFGGPDIATSSGAAAHLTAMLPLIGVAFLIARTWRGRGFALVAGALTVNAIILCRTRSAFVGLMAGLIAALVLVPKDMRYRLRVLLVCGGLMGFYLTDAHYWERIGTLADPAALNLDAAAMARADIRAASLQIIADYPLGIGLGNFPNVIGQYAPAYSGRAPHNTVVMCATELGIIGCVLFFFILVESLRLAYLNYRLARFTEHGTEHRIIAYGLLVALITYFVSGLGTDRFTCESFWWIIVLPLCQRRVIANEIRALAADPAAEEPLLASTATSPFPESAYSPGIRYGAA
ncbi:MAG: O-antigen ligase family protein [Phycisphaerae bacterium]|nr:O-antigen ligase family protein [Phycisphaerae bacterium]